MAEKPEEPKLGHLPNYPMVYATWVQSKTAYLTALLTFNGILLAFFVVRLTATDEQALSLLPTLLVLFAAVSMGLLLYVLYSLEAHDSLELDMIEAMERGDDIGEHHLRKARRMRDLANKRKPAMLCAERLALVELLLIFLMTLLPYLKN